MIFADILNEPVPLPTSDFGAALGKMLVALFGILFLLFATYYFLKKMMRFRFTKGMGSGSIHLIEKKMISPKTMLYYMEVDGKKILFAESHLEIRELKTSEITSDEKSSSI